MKRYKKYEKMKKNDDNCGLVTKCKNIVYQLSELTPLSTQDIYWILAIRLKIKPEDCQLKTFDDKMLEKALKELKLMLELV